MKHKKERTVVLEFDEDVVIRKWSTMKLLHVVGLMCGIGKDSIHGIYDSETGTWDKIAIAENVLAALADNSNVVIQVITMSIPDADVTKVQELDPEDMLEVVTQIIDQNLTEGLGKKVAGLLGAFIQTTATVAKGAQPQKSDSETE